MTDNFSLYNYKSLSAEHKNLFNKAFSIRLSAYENEIKKDEDLCFMPYEELFSSYGTKANTSILLEELYSKITSGIQAGSGDQTLFLRILNAFVEAWSETIKE